jgi:hypothetical protein
MQLPEPDIVAIGVDISSLEGTARSIAEAAQRAGWDVRASRALGPRIPRTPNQPVERTASVAVIGTMLDWRFTAVHTDRDGWDVVIVKPGWPPMPGNVTTLRAMLRAQTPTEVR